MRFYVSFYLRLSLLLLFLCAVIYFGTNLKGSRLDRTEQLRDERYLNAKADKCFRGQHNISIEVGDILDACGLSAAAAGAHQKVVSFSFFGERKPWRKYLKGVDDNAILVSVLYPGWRMRVYHCVERGSRWWRPLEGLRCTHQNLDLCHVCQSGKTVATLPMLWRTLPATDRNVDVFVSRDLDSRISERERAAVFEWLESNTTFHVMRDYPGHESALMGGLWGMRVHQDREILVKAIEDTITADAHWGMTDQDVLEAKVWPLTVGRIMQHDAYSCNRTEWVAHGGMRPFPTRRKYWEDNNFVGAIFNDPPLQDECPVQCRPFDHPEWTTC